MARIAVVDDSADFVDLVVACLEEEGYQALAYYQGDQTFALLREVQPDLILLDLWLAHPQMGWQILDLLRLDPVTQAIPVIVCSADCRQLEERSDWLEQEAIPALAKPFDLDGFLDLVASLVQPGVGSGLHAPRRC